MSRAPSAAERRRFTDLADLGCLACALEGHRPREPDMHHLLAGYRRGHDATIALCPWHHRGIVPGPWCYATTRALLGPSLAIEAFAFHERYGSDDELLAMQNERLAAHRERIVGARR